MSITMTTVILFAVFGVLLFLGVLSPSALWRRLS